MTSRLTILALVMLVPLVAGAQPRPVDIGSRVRVTAPSAGLKKYAGTIAGVWEDSLSLVTEGVTRTVSVADLRRLEASTGLGTNVKRYAGIGGGIGFAGGALIGIATYEKCVPQGFMDCFMAPSDRAEAAMLGGAIGGILGVVVGTFSGAAHRTEQWSPARLPMRAAVAQNPSGGVRVILSRGL